MSLCFVEWCCVLTLRATVWLCIILYYIYKWIPQLILLLEMKCVVRVIQRRRVVSDTTQVSGDILLIGRQGGSVTVSPVHVNSSTWSDLASGTWPPASLSNAGQNLPEMVSLILEFFSWFGGFLNLNACPNLPSSLTSHIPRNFFSHWLSPLCNPLLGCVCVYYVCVLCVCVA